MYFYPPYSSFSKRYPWRLILQELEEILNTSGKGAAIFSSIGPAGILAIYPSPGIPLKWVFMNEFFAVSVMSWYLYHFRPLKMLSTLNK